jgi:hypothetical protein
MSIKIYQGIAKAIDVTQAYGLPPGKKAQTT